MKAETFLIATVAFCRQPICRRTLPLDHLWPWRLVAKHVVRWPAFVQAIYSRLRSTGPYLETLSHNA